MRPYRIYLLSTISAIMALLGIWIAAAPSIIQQKQQAAQDALLQSVENGSGEIMQSAHTTHTAETDIYSMLEIGGAESSAPPTITELSTAPQKITGIGILTIQHINLKMPVTAGASAAQLDIAAGWIPETAPIGETGNAVIAGHRSYTHGRQFNRLGELEAGDVIEYAPIDGEPMTFIVTELLTIEPGDPAALEQPEDRRLLTLYTCTPIRTATHRLLVRAQRMD